MKCEWCGSDNDVRLYGHGSINVPCYDDDGGLSNLCADCRKEISDFINQKKRKEIELIKYVSTKNAPHTPLSGITYDEKTTATNLGSYDGYDLIMCSGYSRQFLYFGHWNDGGFYRDGEWVDCNE